MMKNKSSNDSLNESIALLEIKRDKEFIELKEHFHEVRESLKPINIIKDTFKAAKASPDIKNGVGKTMIGLASGFLVKNVLFRNSFDPLKMVASFAAEKAASNFASNHLDEIKSSGQKIIHAMLIKLKEVTSNKPSKELQS